MAKSLSIDLRERLVLAVDGGMTRRSAAKRFGVAASTAIKRTRQPSLRSIHPQGGREGEGSLVSVELLEHFVIDWNRRIPTNHFI